MNLEFLDSLLRRYTASRILVVGTVVCIALWIVYRFGFSGGGASETRPAFEPASQASQSSDRSDVLFADQPSMQGSGQTVPSRPKFDAEVLERRISKAWNADVKRLMDQTVEMIGTWESTRADWNRLMVDVGEGDAGRMLAADTKALPRLMELIQIGTECAGDFSGFKSQVETIANDLDQFLGADGDGEITEKTRATIEGLKALVDAKMTDQQASLDELQERIQNAQGKAPADVTLNEVMADYRKAEKRKAVDSAISAREQVRQENAERLLEAERMKAMAEVELEESKLAADAERLRAETDQTRVAVDRMKQEEDAKLARIRLEADFARDLREINSLLSPFVSQDEHTLYPPNNHLYSGQKTGVSLSAIAKWGALEPSDEGIDAMAQLGQSQYRPLGSFPKYVQSEWKRSPAVKTRLGRAQELLQKYGELLVEKGLLEK